LVLSDTGITYSDASSMSMDEIMEANAALDIMNEQIEKKMKESSRRQ